jgi:hypothetical protein
MSALIFMLLNISDYCCIVSKSIYGNGEGAKCLCTKALYRYQGHLGFCKWHSTFSVPNVIGKTEMNSVTYSVAQGHSRSQKDLTKSQASMFFS